MCPEACQFGRDAARASAHINILRSERQKCYCTKAGFCIRLARLTLATEIGDPLRSVRSFSSWEADDAAYSHHLRRVFWSGLRRLTRVIGRAASASGAVDEGTSYHYATPDRFAEADPAPVQAAIDALTAAKLPAHVGASWTTDAPFRASDVAVSAARASGVLAVEMEAPALYAFSRKRAKPVLCLAHVTNAMGLAEQDFEKGEAQGTTDALMILAVSVHALSDSAQ